MPRRSRAREVVLQALYRHDLNADTLPDSNRTFFESRLHHNEALVEFAVSLFQGVLTRKDELDEVLAGKAANWSLDRMAATDRNVLRLGAFELLHTDTPQNVVINEAVDLARRFGSAQSPQFVNGILDGCLPRSGTKPP